MYNRNCCFRLLCLVSKFSLINDSTWRSRFKKMTTLKLKCGAQGCSFETPEVDTAIAWGLLQYHRQDSHAPVGAGGGGGGDAQGARQATGKSSKKPDRPNLDMDTSRTVGPGTRG